MKIKTLTLLALSGMLVACTSATPTLSLPTNPPPTQAPSLPPTKTSTPIPVQASTSTASPAPRITPALTRLAQLGGNITAITIIGDLAYVGLGPRLAVIDISQHADPHLLSQSEPLPGLVTGSLQVSSGLLLLRVGRYLVEMDISDPRELKPLQQLELDGGISAMVWDGHASILYLAGAIYVSPGSSGYDGFIASLDFTPGVTLKIRTSVTLPEIPLCLALGENSLFAGANGDEGGLYYVRLDTPGELSAPQLAIASTPGSPLVPSSMQVVGRQLFLGYWGVQAYDITDPSQPLKSWAGSVTGVNIVTAFSIAGDQVYVTGFAIRDPDIPVFGVFTAPAPIHGEPIGLADSITAMHKGDFIVADRSLNIFSPTAAQDLQLVGSYLPAVTNAIDAVANDRAIFVVDDGVGDGHSNSVLWVLGLPDLLPLGKVTTEFPNGWWEGFRHIALEGDRLYLATSDTVWVYDVNMPQPVLLGKVGIYEEQLEAITALNLGEKRLLFTIQSNEDKYHVLWVLDLTDLQKPITSGNPFTLDQGWGAQMTWTGSTLYIFLERSFFAQGDVLYAISFYKDVLELKGSLALAGYTSREAVGENLIVLVGSGASMSSASVSVVRSETLQLISTLPLPGNGVGVALVSDIALVVVDGSWDWGGEAHLLQFDLQDPRNPLQVGASDVAYSHNSHVTILYSSPYVILANGAAGVELFSLLP